MSSFHDFNRNLVEDVRAHGKPTTVRSSGATC